MYRRRVLIAIIIVALLISTMSVDGAKKKKKKSKVKRKVTLGPQIMSRNESMSCDEFSKNARFNPYTVLDDYWFVFFYWASPMAHTLIFKFAVPTANYTQKLKKYLDGNVTIPVNWTAPMILMRAQDNSTCLLVQRNDRGYYWQYLYHYKKDGLMAPRDIRLKQTSDGRLLGFMDCEQEVVFIMSKINEVPPKNRLQEEAARLGYRCRMGRSYLYQGHEWAPVGEDEESRYWARPIHEVYPELADPQSQNVLDDLSKLRERTSQQNIGTPDLRDSKFEDINMIRFNAQDSTIKEAETSPIDPLEAKLNGDFNEPESVTEELNSDTTHVPPQTTEELAKSESATEAIRQQQLTEPEEANKIDTSSDNHKHL